MPTLFHRWILLSLVLLLLAAPVAAQEDAETLVSTPLLEMLALVPDTEVNRRFITYGDLDAWAESWSVGRYDDLTAFDSGLRGNALFATFARAWAFIGFDQTALPDVFARDFLLIEGPEYAGFYGFDVFSVARHIYTVPGPDSLTIVQLIDGYDVEGIGAALQASGYEASPVGDATLYSILEDGEIDMLGETIPFRVGQLGALNRIAVSDGLLYIGRTTEIVTEAVSGSAASLADDSAMRAVALAMDAPELADTGELVGAFFMEMRDDFTMANFAATIASTEVASQFEEMFASFEPLPAFDQVMFATRHSENTTYLVLALAFPPGADVDAAAKSLGDRLATYVSLRTRSPMSEFWTFDRVVAVEAEGVPVAVAVMTVPDPAFNDDFLRVFGWAEVVFVDDIAFLLTE